MNRETKLGLAGLVCGVLLLFGVPTVMAQLQSKLVVEHRLPGARLENLRLVADEKLLDWSDSRLLPGETARLDISPFQAPARAKVRFDLVVDGSRVVLTTRQAVQLERGASQRLTLDRSTAVEHAMDGSPPAPSAPAPAPSDAKSDPPQETGFSRAQ